MTKLSAPLLRQPGNHPLHTQQYATPVNLQQLIDERKVMRVMQPDLLAKVKTAVRRHSAHPHVMQFNGQLYLNLHTIKNEYRRERIFCLLRKLQIGEEIDVMQLPPWLQQIVEPGQATRRQLIGSATAGILIGIASGILVMAIGVLIMAMIGTATVNETGMQNTAVVFVVATIVGWVAATVGLWWQQRAAAGIDR